MSDPTIKEKAVDVKNDVVELAGRAAKATEETAIEATDGLEDLYRLAEEECGAVRVVPDDRRQQVGLREHLPDHEDEREERELPEAQGAAHASTRLRVCAYPLRTSSFIECQMRSCSSMKRGR